jgi:uncharacterized cupin superfamily protein
MTEARLIPADDGGEMPADDGWFVLNAKDAPWLDGPLGKSTGFEGNEPRFRELGVNLNVLAPGEPMTMYHRENAQEDFLVLSGECVLIVDGEERPLKQWDLFHCPRGVDHAIVGGGDGPSLVLAVGARHPDEDEGLVYPAHPAAQKHGAAVDEETTDGDEAYAKYRPSFRRTGYEKGWLPD